MLSPGYAPDPGGVETVVTELSRAMTRLGVDVEVWAHGRDLRDVQLSDHDGVVVRRFPAKGSARYPVSTDLWRHAANSARDFDVVHGHSFHSVAALGLLRQREPFVFTSHYHGVGHTRVAQALHTVYRPVGRRLVERASAVVAVSSAEAGLLRRDFPAASGRVHVIHHGVDSDRLGAAVPLAEPWPVALVLGRLEPYKRVDRVIDAFHRTSSVGRLVILGDGPDRSRLESCAAAGPRTADISFLGRVGQREADRWLRTARLVVNMSEREAFGLVAWEGAAAGARVLLSDIPAHREVAAAAPGHIRVCAAEQLPRLFDDLLALPTPPPVPVRSWEEAAYEHLAVYDVAMRREGVRR